MRRAVKLAIGLLALIACILAISAVFLATVGDDFYRRLLRDQIAGLIDRDVQVEGTFSFDVSLEPSLSVTDVRIANAPWSQGRDFAHLARAEVQIVLRPLLSGIVHLRRLALEGLTLRLETAADGRANWRLRGAEADHKSDAGPDGGRDAFYPLLESVALDDIAVTYENKETGWASQLLLDRLRKSRRSGDGSFDYAGHGRLNDNPFEISGHFGSLEDALAAAEPYPMALSFALPGLDVDLAGTAANLPRAEGFALDLAVVSPSLGDLLGIWEIERAVEGRAKLSAHLAGDLQELSLPAFDLVLEGRSDQRLHAAGSMRDVMSGQGIDLRVDGHLVPGVGLLAALPAALRDLDEIDLRGRLTGRLQQPVIEDFETRLRHPSGLAATLAGSATLDFAGSEPSALALRAEASAPDFALLEELAGANLAEMGGWEGSAELALDGGRLVLTALSARLPETGRLVLQADGPLGTLSPEGFDVRLDPRLRLSLSGESSRALLALTDDSLPDDSLPDDGFPDDRFPDDGFPDAGPFSASGLLVSKDGRLRLEDLRAAVGAPGQLQVTMAGGLDDIGFDAQSEPVLTATLRFSWPSSQALAPYLGQDLVELGPAKGSLALVATPASADLSAIAVETASADGLSLRASAGRAALDLTGSRLVKAFAIDMAADSTTTRTVARLFGRALPELGPIRASGRLEAANDKVSLSGLTGSVGPQDEPHLQVLGEVRDLIGLADLAVEGSFRVPAAQLLGELGVTAQAPLGSLQGAFELTDADGSLGVEALTAELVETRLATLSVAGLFDDLRDRDEFEFETSLNVPDVRALGLALAVPDLFQSPLTFSGRVRGSDEAFGLTGEAKVGETALVGSLRGSFASPRPSFEAELSSPVLYFADLGLTPEVEAAEEPASTPASEPPAPSQPAGPPRLFRETPLPFEVLRSFDLALDIRIDELDGVSLDVDSASMKADLVDGRLSVEPLRFNFVGSSVTIRLVIDARPPDARVLAFATLDDLDLGDLFGQIEADVPVDGELDMVIDVQAEGNTPHALAASLNGELDVAIQRGAVRSRALAFTALDLGSWLFARSTRRGYSELNCFVLRFDIVDGVAATETLFLDTDNVQLFGDGDIDLEPESINLDMNPRAKTRRIANLTTRFSIEGDLARPRVNVSTGSAAARTIGEIVLTPVNLLGRLLPFVNDRGDDADNPCVSVEVAEPAP